MFWMYCVCVCVWERKSVFLVVVTGIWICQASSSLYLTNTPSEEHTNEGRAPDLILAHPYEKDIKRPNHAFQSFVLTLDEEWSVGSLSHGILITSMQEGEFYEISPAVWEK